MRSGVGRVAAAGGALLALGAAAFGLVGAGEAPEVGREVVAARVLKPPRRAAFRPDELLVRFRPGTPRFVRDDLLRVYRLETLDRIAAIDRLRVRLPKGGRVDEYAAKLAAAPDVLNAEPNYLIYAASALPAPPNDTFWVAPISKQWPIGPAPSGQLPDRMNAQAGWQASAGDPGTVVALLDTGIHLGHTEFAGQTLPGINLVTAGGSVQDDNVFVSGSFLGGHGTMMAGAIGAVTGNADGIASVAPYSRILPVKVLNQDASGDVATLAKGIVWAVDNGARVVNCSLASPAPFLPGAQIASLSDAVEYAWKRDVSVVCAAGNWDASLGYASNTPHWPGAAPHAIAIAGSDPYDAWGTYSVVSDPSNAWRIQLVAPGGGEPPAPTPCCFAADLVYTTIVAAPPSGAACANCYYYTLGTSIATAHVSGAIANLLALSPGLDPERVALLLARTADKIPPPSGTTYDGAGWNPYVGYGRINMGKLLVVPLVTNLTIGSAPTGGGAVPISADCAVHPLAAPGTSLTQVTLEVKSTGGIDGPIAMTLRGGTTSTYDGTWTLRENSSRTHVAYRVKVMAEDTQGLIGSAVREVTVFGRLQAYAYPSPYAPERGECRIVFALTGPSPAVVTMRDSVGDVLRRWRLGPGETKEGLNEVVWDGRNDRGRFAANGVYFAAVQAEGLKAVVKIAVLHAR